MKLIRFEKCAISLLLAFIYLFGCLSIANAKEPELLDHEITVFESEEELINFFKKMNQFNQLDKEYLEERKEAERKKTQQNKRIETFIVDGLSAEEIGEIPALSTGPALELRTHATSRFKQVGDYLLIWKEGILHSIKLNENSRNPPELLSSAVVKQGEKEGYFTHRKILLKDDLLILTSIESDNDLIEFSFYNFDESGKFEFNQRYTSNIVANFGYAESKIVDGNLVFITSTEIGISSLTRDSRFLELTANVETEGFDKNEIINIASDTTWVKTHNAVRHGIRQNSYNLDGFLDTTVVLNCPLNDIENSYLECSTTNLLGAEVSGSEFSINDNGVYIWKQLIPSVGNEKLSVEEYSNLIRSKEGYGLTNNISQGKSKKVIYRVDLYNGDVGAVFTDSLPMNYSAFQENRSLLSGVAISDNGMDINGFVFDDYHFSKNPTVLPTDSYQALLQESKSKFIGYVGSNAIMSQSVSIQDETKTILLSWNIDTREVVKFSPDFDVIEVHLAGENVLILGKNEQNHLVIETWAVIDSPDRISNMRFTESTPFGDEYVTINFKEVDGDYIFILKVSALDEKGKEKKHPDPDDYSIIRGVQFFKVTSDGQVSALSDLIVKEKIECNKKSSCFDTSKLDTAFFSEDYIHVLIDDELLWKGEFFADSILFSNWLNIKNGSSNAVE